MIDWLKFNDKRITKFFIEEYKVSQKLNPNVYRLDLESQIDKNDMIEYFLDTLFVLEIAYKNAEKSKHLNKQNNASSTAQKGLRNRITKYKRAIDYLQS